MRKRMMLVLGLLVALVALATLAPAFAADPVRAERPVDCLGGASSIEATVDAGVVRASEPVATGCAP